MGDGKTQFYTPSGNYNVSFEVIDAPFVTPPGGTTQIFRVLANPHGPSFAEVGSAVDKGIIIQCNSRLLNIVPMKRNKTIEVAN